MQYIAEFSFFIQSDDLFELGCIDSFTFNEIIGQSSSDILLFHV